MMRRTQRKSLTTNYVTDTDRSGETASVLALEWAVAVLASSVAVALSWRYFTHAGALWRDEINSVNTQLAPTPSAMWQLEEFESFPLLWSFILRGWLLSSGAGDAGLRLFGVVSGLTLVAAVWYAARRSGAVPFTGLALLAVNPEVIRWASTVRAWGLGAALAVVTMVSLRDAATSPTRRKIAIAVLAGVLSVQCVYQNAVFVAAGAVGGAAIAICQRRWRPLAVALGIAIAAAVSLLPYASVIQRRGEWSALGQTPLTMTALVTQAAAVFDAAGSVTSACWLGLAAGAVWLAGRRLLAPSGSSSGNRSYEAGIWTAAMIASGTVGLALFYLRFSYFPQSWYFLGLVALAAVGTETIIVACAPSFATRRVLAVVALVVVIAGVWPAWRDLGAPQTNIDGIAARVESVAGPEDLVIVNPWYHAITFERYYHGRARVMSVPPIDDHSVHRYDLVKAQMFSSGALDPVFERTREVLVAGNRVWYVGPIDVPPPDAPHLLHQPPPLPNSGWSLGPYQQFWSLQVGAFLQTHVVLGRRLEIDVVTSPIETTSLTELSGWR